MATRKKTNTEVKSAGEEFAAAPQRARALKSTSAETSAAGSKPAARKSSAATHKAPARKTVLAAAAETVVETVVVETVTFDVAAHHEEIGKEAYYNWLRRGCPHGSEQEDWLAAIEIVRARYTA
jgi:hypothetical protein